MQVLPVEPADAQRSRGSGVAGAHFKVPLVDLQAQYSSIQHEVLAAVEDVLGQMQLFLGPQLKLFEQEFAAHGQRVGSLGDIGCFSLYYSNVSSG